MDIVLVDDEEAARFLLEQEIRKVSPDASLWAFETPKALLEHLKKHTAQVAFVDIEMPGMTGLELAKKIKKINSKINIIFCTAYNEYGLEAMKLHASGYILKPPKAADVGRELENLRYQSAEEGAVKRLFAKCFGEFELFCDGRPVPFNRTKSKEIMAILIDRNGTGITRRELSAIMMPEVNWDERQQNYLSKLFVAMEKSLALVGAESILITNGSYYSIDTSKIDCDYYEYLRDPKANANLFTGEYMSRYAWGEETLGRISFTN